VIPRATYRLQFHAGFRFEHARAILPYLQRLGISHVYASPLLRARPGSTHGYDVVACDEINPELGGRPGFDALCDDLRARGMGLLLDIVPNHMGVGPDNAWWMDVLAHGPASAHARWFDIDWHPGDPALEGRVLLPVLGRHFGEALEAGELHVALAPDATGFELRYFEHRVPLDPRTVAPLLADADDPELRALAGALAALPGRVESARGRRADEARPLGARLQARLAGSASAREALERALAAASAPDALEPLVAAQAWRLVAWRNAADEINYRRFFDINELVALRMEEPGVFEATHGFVLGLVAQGRVDGLRIDHPDGLSDPAAYFQALQAAAGTGLRPVPVSGTDAPAEHGGSPQAGPQPPSLYVVVEKIEAVDETLRPGWPVHGTTGYRIANELNGLFVDPAAEPAFDREWRAAGGEPGPFADVAWRGRHDAMREAFAAPLDALAAELHRIAREHRASADFSLAALRATIAELAACMPVYRGYVADEASAEDVRVIDHAVAEARRRAPALDAAVLAFVRDAALARGDAGAPGRHFARRFQQFTAPVAAKGVEDTAFYRFLRFPPLNEVGGDPGVFGTPRADFHAANARRAAAWPHALSASSTHDNKRSEDVRCRLDVLSERPAAWRRLRRALERQVAAWPAQAWPPPAERGFLLMTLLGIAPAGVASACAADLRERLRAYALKAAREAKQRTSWVRPDAAYERSLADFVDRLTEPPSLAAWQPHVDVLGRFGGWNGVALAALKATVPGVPDCYQGCELVDLSLVDPDNRRPVDYARREAALEALASLAASPDWRPGLAALAATPEDGRLKLWTTWRLLQLRAANEALLRDGDYVPLEAAGARQAHVVAFARRAGGDCMVVLAARWLARLLGGRRDVPVGTGAWGDTRVHLGGSAADGPWLDVLTGAETAARGGAFALADAFSTLPVAVLVRAA